LLSIARELKPARRPGSSQTALLTWWHWYQVGTLTILVVAGLHAALPAFPWQNVCADGYEATSPVGRLPC
jgi:hypothetical protein